MKKKSLKSKVNSLRNHVSKLSYESSLNELDNILNQLQNESINLEEIKEKYIEAKAYLQHCETLLDIANQEVLELDSITLEIKESKT